MSVPPSPGPRTPSWRRVATSEAIRSLSIASAASGSRAATRTTSSRHAHHCEAVRARAQFSSSSAAPWMYSYPPQRARAYSALLTSDAHRQCTHANG